MNAGVTLSQMVQHMVFYFAFESVRRKQPNEETKIE